MIRAPGDASSKRVSRSVEAKDTKTTGKSKVEQKQGIEAPPDQMEVKVDHQQISNEGVSPTHGGSTIEFQNSALGIAHQPIAPSGKKAKPPSTAARIKALEVAGNAVIEALADLRWSEVPRMLEDVGIKGAVRMGPMPEGLAGPEERLHRLEWFLGQVHVLVGTADEFSGRWAGGVEHFVRDFKNAPVGTDLVEHFRTNDKREKEHLADFSRAQTKAGLVVSDSDDYQKIAGSGWFNAHELKGRQGTFLLLDWDTRSKTVLSGEIQPKPGGSALFDLVTKNGVVEVNANHIKRHAIVDDLPKRRDGLRAAAQAEGMFNLYGDEASEILGHSFDIGQLAGRRARLINYDGQTRNFSFLEGKLAKDPDAQPWGNALFALETENGLTKLNSNHTRELWVEDLSETPRSKIPERAKEEGYARHQEWFDAAALDGRPVWLLQADKKAGVYRLEEGVVRQDPKAGGNALFLLEKDGKKLPRNINDFKEVWIKS